MHLRLTLLVVACLLAVCTIVSARTKRLHEDDFQLTKPHTYIDATIEHTAVEIGQPMPFVVGAQNNYTFVHSSGVRLFYLYVPSAYTPTKNVSLVFAIHGLTDHAIPFAVGRTNMTTKAEAMNFIVLYPQGTTGYRGTGWNAGTCCVGQDVDDLGFITDLLALIQQNFAIRTNSIHSMGFSNGTQTYLRGNTLRSL